MKCPVSMRVVSKKQNSPQWGAGRRGAGRPAHSRPSSHSTRSRRAADAAPRHAQRVAAARCPLPAAACIASHQRSTPATKKHSPRNARPDLCRRLPAAQVPNKQQTVGVCELRVRSWTTSWARAVSRHLICSPREGLCQSSKLMCHLYAKRIDSSAAQVQVNSVNFMSENQSGADTAADDDVSPFPSSLSSGAIWAKDASVDSAAAAAEPGVGDGSSPTGVAGGEAADRKAPHSLLSHPPVTHPSLPPPHPPGRLQSVHPEACRP